MFLLIMSNFHKLGFTYSNFHLPNALEVQNSFTKQGKCNRNNNLGMSRIKVCK